VKTALLHYWLTNMRGGEKVFAALGDMFPDADVFTHAFVSAMRDEDAGPDVRRWRGHPVFESFIAGLPFGRKWPQAYLPLLPAASRALKLDGYDLIVSSESGPIKGITKPEGTRHVCYCHTPMRYVWDMYDEYRAAASLPGKAAMSLFRDHMRKEDLKSAEAVDRFVANSAFVAERIRRIYGRDSVVVYPPVNVGYFGMRDHEKKDYYLYAGELRAYKRPDLAVRACKRMGRKLVVAGNGKMQDSLASLASGNNNIRFLGRVSDKELCRLYGEARALLFPGVEDFGIVPVEAQAAGTPVIALRKGGVLETVKEGKSGLFFNEETVESLCAGIEDFESRQYFAADCRRNAANFSPDGFKKGMEAVIAEAIR